MPWNHNIRDQTASHWRDSPFYIKELEDYEIPEEWWRSGYTPFPESPKSTPKPSASEVPVTPTPRPAAQPRPATRPPVAAPTNTTATSRPAPTQRQPTPASPVASHAPSSASHVHGPTPLPSSTSTQEQFSQQPLHR